MLKMLKLYHNLPTNIYILFFVRFINAFGDFVVPFLSLFITLKLGYSTAFASTIVTVTVLIQIPGSMLGGMLADRWSKKGTYLLAQGSAAFCILLCGFITNRHILISLLLLSAFFGSAVRPVLNALVYDLVGEAQRKIAYSFLYLGINIGVSVGPLLSGYLFKHYLTIFFVCDALTSFIAVSLVAFFVKVPVHTKTDSSKKKGVSFFSFFKILLHQPQLGLFFLQYLFIAFMYSQHQFSLPLLLKEVYADKSSVYFGYLMSVNALTVVSMTTVITYLTRKKSLLFNISLASAFLGVGFGILGLSTHYYVFILSTILWTLGEVLLFTNVGIYVVQHCDASMRTTSSAFQTITTAAGNSLGILTMGGVITYLGIHMVWPIIFLVGLLLFLSIQFFEKTVVLHADQKENLSKAS